MPDNNKDSKNIKKEEKKEVSYTEYYKIKSNIELHKKNLQQEVDKLNKLARQYEVKIEKPKFEEKLASKPRKTKIIETGIIIAIFIIVLGIIAYISLAGLFPDYLPFSTTGYTIAAEDSKILQSGIGEFYIDDTSVLGDKQTYQGQTIRPITSSKKFNLIFKPAKTINTDTAALSLNLVMLNNSNIYLNDALIFPNLDDYELIKETSDGYNIYIRKDIMENIDTGNLKDEDSASMFLYNNFPSSSVWSTSELGAVNPTVEDYKQEITEINTTFRGDLHLAVYAKDNLNIKLTKQDLNWYLGNDEYTINIANYNGDVIYTGVMEDDGINEKGATGQEQDFEINKEVEEGIYYIDFIIDRDNEASDSSIKNIRTNSNKAVILGTFLPIAPFEFYTSSKQEKTISFLFWHSNKNQLITINENTINLSEDWFEKKYEHNLTAGEYNIDLEKGDLGVYTDIVSPSSKNWFNLPLNINAKFNSQDFLVIDSYTYDHYNRLFYFENGVYLDKNGEGRFSMRALEENAVAIESINLELG